MDKLRQTSGFGLIEAMIVTVIVGILSIAVATLLVDQQRGVTDAKFKLDTDNFNEEIRALLSSPGACTKTFGGILANSATNAYPTVLKDASGAPVYFNGMFKAERSIKIRDFNLANYQATGLPNSALLTLTTRLDSGRDTLGSQLLRRTIAIRADLTAGGAIANCIALAKMSDGIWTRDPSNLNNIRFMGTSSANGMVGIGVTTPGSPLDVAGPATFRPRTPGGIAFANDAQLSFKSNFGNELLRFNVEDTTTVNYVWRNQLTNSVAGADTYLMAFRLAGYGPQTRDTITFFGGLGNGPLDKLGIAHGNFYVGTTCVIGESCAPAWPTVSDARLKIVRRPFEPGLEALLQINPVYYVFNGKGGMPKTEDAQLGVIAQDVEKGAPELVTSAGKFLPGDAEPLRQLNYAGLTYIAINAIKEMHASWSAERDAAREELRRLRAENAALVKFVCRGESDPAACASGFASAAGVASK